MYEPSGVYYFRLLLKKKSVFLNPSKLYCSAQWSTSVVLLCLINKMNTNTNTKEMKIHQSVS